MRRVQNIAWVQSQQGWTMEDVKKAIADANAGIAYHLTRPTLEQVRG